MKRLIYYIPWILLTVLYSPVFYELYTARWKSIDYTHAYFILPLALWLAWRKRGEIFQSPSATSYPLFALLLLVLGLFLYITGFRWDYAFITTFSLIPVLFGLIIYLYGINTAQKFAFPVLYLLLLVPIPSGILDGITLPMRFWTSIATERLLHAMNFPIHRDGLLLSISGHEVFMGPACSGFRSLITMFSLALVYIYLDTGRLSKKLILVLSVAPFALLGNIVRASAICLIANFFGNEAAEGFFHGFSGIVVFVIMIGLLLLLEKLLDRAIRNDK
jgi:exosortase